MALDNRSAILTVTVILTWFPANGQLPATSARPLYLSGKVMLENGAVPPKRVAIERRCGGPPLTVGYTDSQGSFNLQMGHLIPDTFQDASSYARLPATIPDGRFPGLGEQYDGSYTDNQLPEREWMECQLGAQLGGYQSQWIDLGRRRILDTPDIGVILLHHAGASEAEGTDVSSTGKSARPQARKAYKSGLEMEKRKSLDEALVDFKEATASYPGYAAAWNELGRIQAAQGQFDSARTSFERSIAADEKYVLPYLHLSALEYRSKRWQPLADISHKALVLDPFHYPRLLFWNAVANYNLHRLEQSEESARRAEQLDINNEVPEVSRLLGFILAARQDFPAAAAELRKYLKLAPNAPDGGEVRSRLAEIEQAAKNAPSSPPR